MFFNADVIAVDEFSKLLIERVLDLLKSLGFLIFLKKGSKPPLRVMEMERKSGVKGINYDL